MRDLVCSNFDRARETVREAGLDHALLMERGQIGDADVEFGLQDGVGVLALQRSTLVLRR